MQIGQMNITKEDMPSYESFKSTPNHLYNTMKDVLQPKLQMMAMQQIQQNVPQLSQNTLNNGGTWSQQ